MLALGKAAIVVGAALLFTSCDGSEKDQTTVVETRTPAQGQPPNQTGPVDRTQPPPALPPIEPGKELPPHEAVYAVTSIDLKVLEREPAALEIHVKGTTRTGGWSQFYLNQLAPPQVDMDEVGFAFVGLRPKGIVTEALTPVETTFVLDPLPSNAKLVRVMTETNEMTVEIKR